MLEFLKEWLEGSVAAYAAIVATAALALEIRRWFETGPRIVLSIMPRAKMINNTYLTNAEDDAEYILVSVANRGGLPTSITHMNFIDYGSFWGRLRRRHRSFMFVNNPGFHSGQQIPYVLQPGNLFSGLGKHDEKTETLFKKNWTYVGIQCSHTERPFLIRLKDSKLKIENSKSDTQ